MIPAIIGTIAARHRVGGNDPYFANVSSLLHFDGADSSTSIIDEKSVAWTAVGNARLSTAQAVAGSASLILDGDGDMVTSGSISAFGFGTGDFTVECFFRPSTFQNGNRFLFDARVVGGDSWMLWCSQGSSENALGWSTEIGTDFQSGGSFAANVWQHVALTRASGIYRGFLGGVNVFVGADSRDYGASQGIQIGSSTSANQGAIGWVDDFRVTKGIARYTAGFTPPTPPFPNA